MTLNRRRFLGAAHLFAIGPGREFLMQSAGSGTWSTAIALFRSNAPQRT